ncbi:MAG: calcium-binding protein, partial [Pseudomonadota bacterium]
GRIEDFLSFAQTTSYTGGAEYLDSYRGGDGDDTVTLQGGAGSVVLGRGENVLTVTDNSVDSVSTNSEGSAAIQLGAAARINQARIQQQATVDVAGSLEVARLSDFDDVVTYTGNGRSGALRLLQGDNTVNMGGQYIDMVEAYDGNDTINLTSGRIGYASLGNGSDEVVLSGGVLNDLDTGRGNDTLTVTGGDIYLIRLSDGNNVATIDADSGSDLFLTFDGRDRLTAESWIGTVRTGGNRDIVTVNGGAELVSVGDGKDDVTTGTEFVEAVNLGSGNDRFILGSGGANYLRAGDGLDFADLSEAYVQFIWMGNDNDRLVVGNEGIGMARMGDGNDTIFVNQLDMFRGGLMNGGGGEDTLDFSDFDYGITFSLDLTGQYQMLPNADGNMGVDEAAYVGELGIEKLNGTRFDDTLTAEDSDKVFAASNTLNGLSGNDTLISLGTDDFLNGGGGVDLLFGGDGVDVLRGDGGRDTLQGDAGDDRLYGGTAADDFVFLDNGQNGQDRIKDWEDGSDELDLTDFGFASFAQVLAIASNSGSLNMKLDFGGGNQVVIENFRLADFDASDVIL